MASDATLSTLQTRRVGRQWQLIRIARKNPLGLFGLFLTLVLVIVGAFAPAIAPYEVNDFVGPRSIGPTLDFPFGTDKFGQDILSRVIHGARISLLVGFSSVGFGTVCGTLLGAFSGFKGGKADMVIQRIVDTYIAFPGLVLLLVIVRVLGPSMINLMIVVGIGIIPGITRFIRGVALSERNNLYVEAARSLGASDARLLMRHILPNVLPLAIVVSSNLLGVAILAEASLSFLGLGIPPPNPSWGADVSAARGTFPINVWAAFFPGLAISLTVMGFNLLGDTIRDVIDPRLRGTAT